MLNNYNKKKKNNLQINYNKKHVYKNCLKNFPRSNQMMQKNLKISKT